MYDARRSLPLLFALLCLVYVACERPSTSALPEDMTRSAVSDFGTPDLAPFAARDTLLATLVEGEEVVLTVQDFERAAQRAMVFAPDQVLERGEMRVALARLQQPFLQSSVTRQLIEGVLVEREAKRRGLDVSLQEVEALITSDEQMRRFSADEDATAHAIKGVSLQDFGLTLADLHDLARKQLLRQKLSEQLVTEISREEVERAWNLSEDRVLMLFVRISHTPSSQEIDDFLKDEAHLAQIKRHFDEHKSRFLTPSVVVVDIMHAEKPERLQALKRAAELLKQGTTPPDQIAAAQGLTLESSRRLVRQEDPRAHGAKPGEVGVSMGAPRGNYAWIVREKIASTEPPLDRSLQREIAAILMREQNAIPSATSRAEELSKVLRDMKPAQLGARHLADVVALMKTYEEGSPRVKALSAEWLQRDPSGFVRGVGTSEALQSAVFELERGGVLSPALPVDQYLWTGVALERTHPDLKVFTKNEASYIAQYKEAIAPTILDMRLAQWQQEDGLEVHMDVLREHYGTYQKTP